MPPRGAGFEFLNKNLLHDAVDSAGRNILDQAKRMNVNVYKQLESGVSIIKENYKEFVAKVDASDHDIP